jgi:hypothetical protein
MPDPTELIEALGPEVGCGDCVERSMGFSMMPLGGGAGVPSEV